MYSLILSRDWQPLFFLPVRQAFLLVFTGRAKIIVPFKHFTLRSVSKTFKVPAVARILSLSYKRFYAKRPSKLAIYFRDNFTCAYCGKQLTLSECTIDHVVPRSKGGDWSWENLVTACKECNSKKADRVKVPVFVKPSKPSVFELQVKTLWDGLSNEIKQFLEEFKFIKVA